MIFSFGIIIPIGVLIARGYKAYKYHWFIYHRVVQVRERPRPEA